jgi:hypothetical protein
MALVSQLLPVSDWAALNESERGILFDFVSAELVKNDQLKAQLKPKVAEFMSGVKHRHEEGYKKD